MSKEEFLADGKTHLPLMDGLVSACLGKVDEES
jgi:hypothetical protein